MARPIITIPNALLRQTGFDWFIEWRGVDNGQTFSGNSAYVLNAKPRWVGSVPVVLTKNLAAQWDAIIAQVQGRHGMLLMDLRKHAAYAPKRMVTSVPLSTGQPLSTDQGIAYEPTVDAASGAARGATSIRIKVVDQAPVPGQIMSHKDWPFMVTYADDLGGGVYELGVQMPLRAAIVEGEAIRMQGRGLFELTDASGGWSSYGQTRISTPTLSLQEVLTR